MRMWDNLKRNFKEGFVLFTSKSKAAEDPVKVMDELQTRLRKSNDALNKIISES